MSCAWPTSSCTLAVSASFRCSVGARRIHSRSGRTPISSLFPCISMNLTSFARYSSGSQSEASTCPPDWTYSRNSLVRASIPYRSVGYQDERQENGAGAAGGQAVRREGVPRDVDGGRRDGDG